MRTEGAEVSPSQRSLLTNQPLLATGAGHLSVDLSANTPPIFYPLLVSSLGLSYGAVGVLSMVQSITSSLSQPFFGWLVDRAGSRWLAPLSVLCAALSIAVLGFAPSYEALLLVVAVMGLGVGAFHPHGAKVASLIGGRWRTTSLSIYIVMGTAVLASLVGVLGGCPQTVTMVAAQEALPGRMAMASGLASSLGMIMGGIGVAFLGVMADRIGLHASMEAMVIAVAVAAVASLAVRDADR